jgi:hypothetical protein
VGKRRGISFGALGFTFRSRAVLVLVMPEMFGCTAVLMAAVGSGCRPGELDGHNGK